MASISRRAPIGARYLLSNQRLRLALTSLPSSSAGRPHCPLALIPYADGTGQPHLSGLVASGFTGWKSPWTFGAPLGTHRLTVVYVRNDQLASAKAISNVRARIDYLHDGAPRFSVPMALWWEEHDRQGLHTSTSVDLEANQTQSSVNTQNRPLMIT